MCVCMCVCACVCALWKWKTRPSCPAPMAMHHFHGNQQRGTDPLRLHIPLAKRRRWRRRRGLHAWIQRTSSLHASSPFFEPRASYDVIQATPPLSPRIKSILGRFGLFRPKRRSPSSLLSWTTAPKRNQLIVRRARRPRTTGLRF